MEILERIGECGLVPVAVIENAADAVPTARALLAGGIDTFEITLRTGAAMEAIGEAARNVPEMLTGAGTVLNPDQAKRAVDAGARFIVSPGLDEELTEWCVGNGIPLTPGCVTPTEIMRAFAFGLRILKFFPANVYGGAAAMKALAGPFGDVKFIPTGGVDPANIGEYCAAAFVHAVGGSWVCSKSDIAGHNFDRITALCGEAVAAMHGFEMAHIGINNESAAVADALAERLNAAFMLPVRDGNSSVFAGPGIEAVKSVFPGVNGHIAIRTNNVDRAVAYLEKKGFPVDRGSAKMKGGRIASVYLKEEMGGFAVHLLQK